MRHLIYPMELGDIFDKTFRTCAANFLANLILVILFCTVPSIVLVYGLRTFYGTMATVGAESARMGSGDVFAAMGGMAIALLGGLGLGVGMLASEIGIARLTCKRLLPGYSYPENPVTAPEPPIHSFIPGIVLGWQDGADAGMVGRMLKAAGFYALVMLLIGGLGITFGILVALASALSSGIAVLMIVGLLLLIPVGIYFTMLWSMVIPVIAWEDRGPIEAMRRSYHLIEDNWWRVTGILFLLGLIVGFGILLLTTPLSFLGILGSAREMFTDMQSGGGQTPGKPSPELLKAFGNYMGINLSISMMLSLLVKPVYSTILYLDLRSRKGEFMRTDPPVPIASAGSPLTAFMPPPDWTPNFSGELPPKHPGLDTNHPPAPANEPPPENPPGNS